MYEPNTTEKIYEVMLEGVQPILAHPERYEYASRENYVRWKDKHYKFQLNLLSLAGAYGSLSQAKAHWILEQGFYDYIGSDMHGLDNFRRFLPELRLKSKDIDRLLELMENNKKLFG